MTTLLLCFCYIGYCQDVKVNINNQEQTGNADCPYRINGICSTEDIGGVDVQFYFNKVDDWCDQWNIRGNTYALFTNYNTFPVTVLFEITYGSGENDIRKGNIVLGIEGSKQIDLYSRTYDYTRLCNVKGIIVRKLQN